MHSHKQSCTWRTLCNGPMMATSAANVATNITATHTHQQLKHLLTFLVVLTTMMWNRYGITELAVRVSDMYSATDGTTNERGNVCAGAT